LFEDLKHADKTLRKYGQTNRMKILFTSYVLAVPDADATAQFFIDKLGFSSQKVIPNQWHFVVREGCRVMLGSCADAIPPADLGDHSYFAYFNVDDIDAFYEEVRSRGLSVDAPKTKPWSMREVAIKTPDGHRMTFGQEV
jgi:catechol 2,3-dioxygenase-like lactoylglutathione lyase family enzyme